MPDLDSFAFGVTPELADELLALVLAGKKSATAWAASEGGKGVEVGKRWIVKDSRGTPRAIIETVELKRRRFEDVDESFAHDEGEGDRTLAWWRRAHKDYFARRGEFSLDMELYCERFRLIESLGGLTQPSPDGRGRASAFIPGRRRVPPHAALTAPRPAGGGRRTHRAATRR